MGKTEGWGTWGRDDRGIGKPEEQDRGMGRTEGWTRGKGGRYQLYLPGGFGLQ